MVQVSVTLSSDERSPQALLFRTSMVVVSLLPRRHLALRALHTARSLQLTLPVPAVFVSPTNLSSCSPKPAPLSVSRAISLTLSSVQHGTRWERAKISSIFKGEALSPHSPQENQASAAHSQRPRPNPLKRS